MMKDEIAAIVIAGLGGRANIKNVENCVTRLRVDLGNRDLVNNEKLKEAGSAGFFFPQKNHIHVVFGTHVEFVRNAVDDAGRMAAKAREKAAAIAAI